MKPGASSHIKLKRTGPVCERSGVEERRTKGGADGMERRRTFRAVITSLEHLFSLHQEKFYGIR
ncbi:MAG TPA: hypothetical protein PK277_09115 [Methanoregulaceae archaeon]|nr:hypothetical protein [Methanoregulaceae archaeon]